MKEDHLEHGVGTVLYMTQSKESLIAERQKIQTDLQYNRQQYTFYQQQANALAPTYNRSKFDLSKAETNLNANQAKYNTAKGYLDQSRNIYNTLKNQFSTVKKQYEDAASNAKKFKSKIDSETNKLADINAAINKKK